MIIKGTKQLGSFKRGVNLYVSKRNRIFTSTSAFNSNGVLIANITGNIPNHWVENNTTVTTVVFANNNSITSIGSHAFANNQLTSVTIPNSVTSIGLAAFGDNKITSLTIPNSITSIPDSAFEYNTLYSLTIPNSVISIGNFAFFHNYLQAVTIPNSVETIGYEAFSENLLSSVTIPDSVTSIGGFAFYSNNFFTYVNCYTTQTAFIGTNAFLQTASPLTIHVRASDNTWTAGTGLAFQGNNNVTVIKDL